MHSLIHNGTVSKIKELMAITLYMSIRTSKTTQLIIMPVKTCHFMQKTCPWSSQLRHFRVENQSAHLGLVVSTVVRKAVQSSMSKII